MLQLQYKDEIETPDKVGWDIFSPEIAWFIYDFFKHKLKPYEQLLFFGYYIMGFTLEELGERCHCSLQRIHVQVTQINDKLKKTWHTKKHWKKSNEYWQILTDNEMEIADDRK